MKKILKNLDSRVYEHSFDKKTLDLLQNMPQLEYIIKAFYKYGIEKLIKIQYTGSNIKVNNKNFSDIYQILKEVCETLYLPNIPDIYILGNSGLNAMTIGVQEPIIGIFSDCIDSLDTEELKFVIGHEVGHIKSNHGLYLEIARILSQFGSSVGAATLGIGQLVSASLELALGEWCRMSEYTADRAGLLACQDVKITTKTMMKIAGLPKKYYNSVNTDDFIEQARDFVNYDYDALNKVAKTMCGMWSNHPWTVMRSLELHNWINSGQYDEILAGKTFIPEVKFHFCKNCGCKINENEIFCNHCGKKVE